MITSVPDREEKDEYKLKIEAREKGNSTGREVPVLFYTLYVSNQEKNQQGQYKNIFISS